jgi:hypothetical protein
VLFDFTRLSPLVGLTVRTPASAGGNSGSASYSKPRRPPSPCGSCHGAGARGWSRRGAAAGRVRTCARRALVRVPVAARRCASGETPCSTTSSFVPKRRADSYRRARKPSLSTVAVDLTFLEVIPTAPFRRPIDRLRGPRRLLLVLSLASPHGPLHPRRPSHRLGEPRWDDCACERRRSSHGYSLRAPTRTVMRGSGLSTHRPIACEVSRTYVRDAAIRRSHNCAGYAAACATCCMAP